MNDTFILVKYKNQYSILDTKTNVYYFMKNTTKKQKEDKVKELNEFIKGGK